jgi:hypothetical protein
MRKNQWAAFVLALLLFGTGLAVGALGHRFYTQGVVNAKTSEDFRQQYVSEMRSRVKLSPEQMEKLQSILDETKAKAHAVKERVHPEMVKIKEEQIARVKSILTQDQIPAYENLVAEREQRARQAEARDAEVERQRTARQGTN